MSTIRVGIVGLGANSKLRHVPGLLECEDVEITGVCNSNAESTARVADEYSIPNKFESWEQLVADPDIDAVVIGTWPYLHCPITLAALAADKHVMTEARMAMNAEEARQMHEASRTKPDLITQIVPSPLGLRAHKTVKEFIADGRLGTLREVAVLGTNTAYADPQSPLHWRQAAEFSGINMLALGILHEPLVRWIDHPTSVMATIQTFTETRSTPYENTTGVVGTPDTVHAVTEIPGGARGIYHLSGVIHHGPANQVHLYGSEGTLKYRFDTDTLYFGSSSASEITEVVVPEDDEGGWRVEEEFINAIRGIEPIEFTTFQAGVKYMEFTEAVLTSAETGELVSC